MNQKLGSLGWLILVVVVVEVILSVVGAIDKRNRGKIALRSSCLLAMVRRKRRVLSYRLSGEIPAGAYKARLG
jgi:hypothetical protein